MIVDSKTTTKRMRGNGTGGRFFVLDRVQWDAIFALPTPNRMNLALAYLVLLAGTGADHRFTKWSTTAITHYTGMRKDSARTAVTELIAGHHLERAPTWTLAKPHYNFTATPAEGEGQVIFLPVGLVTGLTGLETTILGRIRETGDPLLLRLLVDLYGEVTIDAAHAVALPSMRRYRRGGPGAEKALEIGAHTVWEMAETDETQSASLDRQRYLAKGESQGHFWARVALLEALGATYQEPWVCSNSSADADPIFPFGEEARVQPFAEAVARALLAGPDAEREWKSQQHDGPLIVLPGHHQVPAIQHLTKMRVEADTPGRRGAYGERERIIAHWVEQYDRLETEAGEGIFSNPLRTQPQKRSAEDCPYQGDQGDQGHQSVQVASSQSGPMVKAANF